MPEIEVDGQRLEVRAAVRNFRCFSAHGDAKDIDAWLDPIRRSAAVVLVHGGPEELTTRAAQLRRQGWTNVAVARAGEAIDLGPE
jgi:Cft2 family RNA processing exonuclease